LECSSTGILGQKGANLSKIATEDIFIRYFYCFISTNICTITGKIREKSQRGKVVKIACFETMHVIKLFLIGILTQFTVPQTLSQKQAMKHVLRYVIHVAARNFS